MRHTSGLLIASLALIGAQAQAAETVTVTAAQIELREADNTAIRDANGAIRRFTTVALCEAAAIELLRSRMQPDASLKCEPGPVTVRVVNDCSDRPAPEFVPTLLEPRYCPPPNEFRFEALETEQQAAPFPICWTIVTRIALACTPPNVEWEYDDPAHPPLSEMVLDPVAQPGFN